MSVEPIIETVDIEGFRLVRVKCSCGSVFHAFRDDFESGKVVSCGNERARQDPKSLIPEDYWTTKRSLDGIDGKDASIQAQVRHHAYLAWIDAGRPWGREEELWSRGKNRVRYLLERKLWELRGKPKPVFSVDTSTEGIERAYYSEPFVEF